MTANKHTKRWDVCDAAMFAKVEAGWIVNVARDEVSVVVDVRDVLVHHGINTVPDGPKVDNDNRVRGDNSIEGCRGNGRR